MKKFISILSFVLPFSGNIQSQITPPYHQNFDSASCTGWIHYALSGGDDWQRGVPSGLYLNTASSAPNVWGTNLSGSTTANSIMELETPDFNLSDLSKIFLLNFGHEYETYSYHGGNIEYSTDLGVTWLLLNGTNAEKQNWYNNNSCSGLGGQPSWSYSNYSSFEFSSHSLAFLQGQPKVRFRFQFGGTSNPTDGWQIDNFSITENIPNITAIQGQTYNASKNFISFDVAASLLYNGLLQPSFSNTTNYYFSKDNVLDPGDSLLGSKSQTINGTISNWSKTFIMIPNLHAGDYYIFYKHDFADNLNELDETDNTNYCILHIDSTFTIPEYKDSFEDSTDFWKAYASPLYWVKGYSNIHQAENPHSGRNSWFIKNLPDDVFGANPPPQYLESPYLDLSPASNNVMCFWYKMKHPTYTTSSQTEIEFSTTNTLPDFTSPVSIPMTRKSGWDCHCESLSNLNGNNNAKIRIKFHGSLSYGLFDENVNIDDIYIGQPKPDLSVENKNNIVTPQSFLSDTLTYSLFNSGLVSAGTSVTEFYWSADSILDAGDQLIASVNELPLNDTVSRIEKVAYTKPTLSPGNYFIIYKLDAGNVINEMREENNIDYFKLKQEQIFPLPYFNNFETQINGWSHNSTIGNDDWKWGAPSGIILNSAFSGTKSFHTTGDTLLSTMSRQHLYTPVFDFSTMPNPVLEFDMKLNSDGSCFCSNAKMNMTYSIDGGASWIILDTTNISYNRWYYPMDYDDMGGYDIDYSPNYTDLLFDEYELSFAAYDQYNSRDADRNTHYVIDLTFLAGHKNIQFRFNIGNHANFNSSPNPPREGAVIDNFKIADKYIDLTVGYKKALMISSLNQHVKFSMDIKNQGNYISNPSQVKFYVSSDTILDGADFYLGQDSIKAIRPDMKHFSSNIFAGPPILSNYSYLLYQIDPLNTNAESNETNNTGYWPLALDSVKTYPYVPNFSDTAISGWNGYLYDFSGVFIKDQFRVRNIIAPGEYLYQTNIVSGELFTDRIDNNAYQDYAPYWYIETPNFDFRSSDSISINFDLMCIGSTTHDGGNLSFSIDGGNSWTVLTAAMGASINWYNQPSLNYMGNEPGWDNFYVFKPVYFNLSFLRGQKNVVLRFKFKSSASPFGSGTSQGFRLKNFKIDAYDDDYIADDSLTPISVNNTSSNINLNYSITSAGHGNGRISNTKFYWSADSIFDSSDSLLLTIPENHIDSGTTLHASAMLTIPTSLFLPIYYVFYFADADSNLFEVNENNNIGSFKLTFQPYLNYHSNNHMDTIHALVSQSSFNINYSITNFGILNGSPTATKFYWSSDNSFDTGDANIQTSNESGILSGNTLNVPLSVTYPPNVTQTNYYLFYRTDADNSIPELDETDNIGSFAVVFNYVNSVSAIQNNGITAFVNNNTLFIQSANNSNGKKYSLCMVNQIGEIIYNSEIFVNAGMNKYDLPNDAASGLYFATLQNEQGSLFWKIVIQK